MTDESVESPTSVLIASLEGDIIESASALLRDRHVGVIDVAGGLDEATAMLSGRADNYDAALIDDTMTSAEGGPAAMLALLRALKQRSAQTRVVILSNWGADAITEALRAGADLYLPVPGPGKEVDLLIQTAVERMVGSSDLAPSRDDVPEDRLELVSLAINEIMASLESKSLRERLDLIAEWTARILNAEVCGVLLVQRQGYLSLEASYGHVPGTFKHGAEFKIQSDRGKGLTGHIAHQAELFNANAEALKNHPAVAGVKPKHVPSGDCYSLLAIPLKKRFDGGERVIGLLRAENKRGADGVPRPSLRFDQSDEWILKIFADAVVVAIESAELVGDLNRHANFLNKLIASSPDAIIAVDQHGIVNQFNERAEKILEYSSEEVLGTRVDRLYYSPDEPKRIGDLIAAAGGYLEAYDTMVKSKSDRAIPIKLSAAFLYDDRGSVVGSVGYFQDLRRRREAERRLDVLLRASNSVVNAESLSEGLKALARMMVSLLTHSFCRILLFDASRSFLSLEAVYPEPGASDGLVWDPGFEERIAVTEYRGLGELLSKGEPELLSSSDRRFKPNLERLSQRLGLVAPIQSLLLVPLRIGSKVIGLVDLGELSGEPSHQFTEQEIALAAAIAAQTSALIERIQLHSLTERREQLLDALNRASSKIREVRGPVKLMREIVRLAANLVDCPAGGLWINRPNLQRLDLSELHGLPPNLIGRQMGHSEGVAGRVAATGKRLLMSDYLEWPGRETAFKEFAFHDMAAVPLKHVDKVEAVLFVANPNKQHKFSDMDIEMLERFANQASIALQTSGFITREDRASSQLRLLHEISYRIQAASNLDNILKIVLYGVTAEIGLRFNRAVLFLLDDERKHLVGKMGVGQFNQQEAREAWAHDEERGLSVLDEFVENLEKNDAAPTAVGKWAQTADLPVSVENKDAFSRVVFEGRAKSIEPGAFEQLPKIFLEAFAPTSAVIAVPLTARGAVIGMLVVDNEFTREQITDDDKELLLTFANSAAIAIENRRLAREAEIAHQKLRSAIEASAALVSSQNPEDVLRQIVDQAPMAAEAAWGRVILIDDMGQAWKQIMGGTNREFDIKTVRPNGISIQVLNSARPIIIPDCVKEADRMNPHVLRQGIKAAVCLPFSIRGRPIGVMWMNYKQPRSFSKIEIDAFQLYVNQAAIAYENARRIEELRRLQRAAQEMAMPAGLGDVLRTIVAKAMELFHSDAAAIWPYDDKHRKFLSEEFVSDGLPDKGIQAFTETEPAPDGITHTVLDRDWVAVNNIHDPGYSFITPEMKTGLIDSKVASFEGIALRVGNEAVGLLYVGYNRPKNFGDEDRRLLRNFAAYAALALKNARLLHQVERARRSARLVAEMTTLGDLDRTLRSVAQGTLSAVSCDAVVLYGYDHDRDHLRYPPTHEGVRFPEKAWPNDRVPPESIVRAILREGRLIVEQTDKDPRLRDRRFVRVEKIQSCVALPLRAGGVLVGVMWVNYRAPNRFTPDELSNIELFANQAAVAIRNAQLFEEGGRKLEDQRGLVDLSQQLLGTFSTREILDRAVSVTAQVLGTEFCSIVLPDENNELVVAAAVGFAPEIVGKLKLEGGRASQAGYTVATGAPVAVADYHSEARFNVHPIVFENGIHSGLSVPVYSSDETDRVVGAMIVQTRTQRQFSDADTALLSVVANQTSIAAKSAPEYERRSAQLTAISEVTRAITSGFESSQTKEVLSRIVEQAVNGLTRSHRARAILTSLQLYDPAKRELCFEAVHPVDEFPGLVSRIGERRSIDRETANGRIGITGRTVEMRAPQLVPEVLTDPDYIPFNQNTLSEMTVPLLDDDLVIGVLNVESDEVAAFDREDVKVLEALAAPAAFVIRNSRLLEEKARHVRQLDAISEVGRAIGASLDPNAALNTLLTLMRSLVNHTAARICLWYEGKEDPLVVAFTGDQRDAQHSRGIFSEGRRYGRLIVQSKQPLLAPDKPDVSMYNAEGDGAPPHSFMGVPVRVDERRMATFELMSDMPSAFGEQDKEVMVHFAPLVAVAIKNKFLRSAIWTGTLGAWGAEIAHDVRREVGAIRRTLANLERHPDLPEELKERVQRADSYAESLIFPTKHGPSAEAGLDKIAADEVAIARKRWPEVMISLEASSPDKRVTMSVWELRRTMKHLLRNAVDADSVDGRPREISVRTWSEKEEAFLQVEDNGPGIPAEIEPQLFWQPIERKGELGFGLLLVGSVVERCGGAIYLRRNMPGVGACFEVRLAIAPESSRGEGLPREQH